MVRPKCLLIDRQRSADRGIRPQHIDLVALHARPCRILIFRGQTGNAGNDWPVNSYSRNHVSRGRISPVKSRSIQERGPHVIRRGLDVDGVSQDQLSSLGFCMNTTADLSPSGASLVHNGRALGTSVRRTVS